VSQAEMSSDNPRHMPIIPGPIPMLTHLYEPPVPAVGTEELDEGEVPGGVEHGVPRRDEQLVVVLEVVHRDDVLLVATAAAPATEITLIQQSQKENKRARS
jgi:hypothetical protein